MLSRIIYGTVTIRLELRKPDQICEENVEITASSSSTKGFGLISPTLISPTLISPTLISPTKNLFVISPTQ